HSPPMSRARMFMAAARAHRGPFSEQEVRVGDFPASSALLQPRRGDPHDPPLMYIYGCIKPSELRASAISGDLSTTHPWIRPCGRIAQRWAPGAEIGVLMLILSQVAISQANAPARRTMDKAEALYRTDRLCDDRQIAICTTVLARRGFFE